MTLDIHITSREREILQWVAEGKTTDEISVILGLAHHTVTTHRTAVMEKLGVFNSAALVATALRKHIIE